MPTKHKQDKPARKKPRFRLRRYHRDQIITAEESRENYLAGGYESIRLFRGLMDSMARDPNCEHLDGDYNE